MQALGSIIRGDEDLERKPDSGPDVGSDSTEERTSGTQERTSESETIAGYPAVEPITWIGGTETPNIPKRRGRPPGTKNRGTTPIASAAFAKETQTNLADLDGLILSAHLLVAKLLSVPELELDEKESAKLANSVRNVAKYYTAVFDPKKIALFELACCAGGIYGPRAIAIYKNTERKPKVVRQMPPSPAQQSEQKVSLAETSPSQLWQEGG